MTPSGSWRWDETLYDGAARYYSRGREVTGLDGSAGMIAAARV